MALGQATSISGTELLVVFVSSFTLSVSLTEALLCMGTALGAGDQAPRPCMELKSELGESQSNQEICNIYMLSGKRK